MSNPVEGAVNAVTSTPKAIVSFAKAKTFAFLLMILLVMVLVIRFRNQIVTTLSGLPVVGRAFAKLFGVAALVLIAYMVNGDATSIGDGVPLIIGFGGIQLAQTYAEDLKAEGGDTSLSITPGAAEVTKTLKFQPDHATFRGRWKRVQSFTLRHVVGVDQPGAGGTAIMEDQLPRTVGGVRVDSPILGELLDKRSGPGPVFKHIMDFVGAGQRNTFGARALIAAADGDTAVHLYLTYHFAPQWGVRAAQDFGMWVGWLEKTQVDFSAAVSTSLDAVSTGAVTEATSSIQGWYEYTLDKANAVPVLNLWRLFEHNAGSKSIFARDWLGAGGIKGQLLGAARVAGVYELFDVAGMGGPDGSDNILSIIADKLGIPFLQNIDALVAAHLRAIDNRRGISGGTHATSAPHDRAGNPYTMSATPNAALNDANLMYLGLRTVSVGTEIARLPLYPATGDLEIIQTYTSQPSSGTHKIVVNTIRRFADNFVEELAARARQKVRNNGRPPLADGNDASDLLAAGYRPTELAILPVELE